MDETFWCHMCSQTVNPIREIDTIKCPICEGGFIEEMTTATGNDLQVGASASDSDSDRALSLWAPILFGMINDPRSHNPNRLIQNDNNQIQNASEAELDRELELILRRRRSSAAILQLLQGIRTGIQSESENLNMVPRIRDRGIVHEGERNNEGVILISPYNEAILVGSYGHSNESQNTSIGDYFIGPRLDLLLQHLLENDPNRHGTPPAKKEAVEALPIVETEETMQCSICLDECEEKSEVKQMPCKHMFHGSCIIPWLELHSCCPICRFQLPCDESKMTNNSGIINQESSNNYNHNAAGENTRQLQLQLPWRLGNLFPSPRTHRNSSSTDIAGSSTGPNVSGEDEN